MKKLMALLLTVALSTALFAGCTAKEPPVASPESPAETSGETAPETTTTGESFKIGLVQLVEHPSLDEIRESFLAELDIKMGDQQYTVDYKNAQADISLITSICRGFVDDGVDVIVAIATPTAQGAASVTTDIPIIFSAVTDPIAAGLVDNLDAPSGNITGVSDAIDVEKIFDLAAVITPDVKSYGLLYNQGEVNSVSVITEVKAYLDGAGISYTEKTVGNTGEVQQAARTLLESNDAVFAPIDNTVASAMTVLSNEAIAAGKPVYVAADSMVHDGGLATVGINYTELGGSTADMVAEVLAGTAISQLPVRVMSDGTPVVNAETAKALGIDVSAYTN